jgi:hypothetical protein
VAPVAPGRLGVAAPADALRRYLDELGRWCSGRRAELDRLDEASLRATDPDSYAGDITLSMALWQSCSDRYDQLVQAWDSGRADQLARERMSQLIWGRLDSGAGLGAGLAVSLVDACRLSDALAAQLRARLSFDPRAADSAARVAALRAAMERLRALAEADPGSVGIVRRLDARVEDLAGAAARGGDVSGPLQILEADAARAERDLIVATATRREAERDRERQADALVRDRVRAMNELAALEHRQQTLIELADRCVHRITLAPRLAVPEPEALGPVPTDRVGVDAFLARLSNVARAMDVVERAYSAPLAELEELTGRLDAYRVMAARTGKDADRQVGAAAQLARSALQAVPCDLDSARTLVAQYQALVRATPARPGTAPATGGPATGGPATGGPATGGPATGGPVLGRSGDGGLADGRPMPRPPAAGG